MTWELLGMRGSRTAVKASVAAAKNVPAGVKAFIAAQIDSLPGDASACRLDAYCQEIESKNDMKVTRNIQITLVAVQV